MAEILLYLSYCVFVVLALVVFISYIYIIHRRKYDMVLNIVTFHTHFLCWIKNWVWFGLAASTAYIMVYYYGA